MSILGDIGTRSTPQRERTPGRTDEVENSAGGFVFGLDDWARLSRFLILGVDGGTYYVGARDLAIGNADVVLRCLAEDGRRTVNMALDVSREGRAPSNDPVLFVLACAAASPDLDTRRYALGNLDEAVRTGTHLFNFVRFAQSRRGWGRGLASAVARWYTERTPDQLAYQVVKYRQRNGWSHRDVLRKAHPVTADPDLNAVLRFAAGQPAEHHEPRIIEGYRKLTEASDADEAAALVREYEMPWEAVPSEWMAGDKVWRALLDADSLPLGALLRNLGVLTNRGVIAQGSQATRDITARLTNLDLLKKARIHPVGVLNALVTYRNGTSRGGVEWTPIPAVCDALDGAFYGTFGNVERTGKRMMLALDVSGSMSFAPCNGAAFTAREGSAAMAMVTESVEDDPIMVGFSGGLMHLDISSRRRLDDNVKAISDLPFDRTDCALPMLAATQNNLDVDTFVVYTDNETWAGNVKPHQALEQYRQKAGHDARLVVVGMTATGFTIADPTDPGMLDVVGFDTATPNVIGAFTAA